MAMMIFMFPGLSAANVELDLMANACSPNEAHERLRSKAQFECQNGGASEDFQIIEYEVSTRRFDWICPGLRYFVYARLVCLDQEELKKQ